MKHHWEFIKKVGFFSHSCGAFRSPQLPGKLKNQYRERRTSIILVCLEMLLPVVEKLLSPEDRTLVDMCTAKLGMVSYVHGHTKLVM
jgi:hypothetical protein